MKSSIFLLSAIFVSAPYAFGQTAPIAVKIPVAEAATAIPNDAELQAKVDAAAQALAKLPANTAGLVAAQERVTKARELVVVPVGFSIGQSARQAHLVVDNLRSARVWCQTSAKTAKAGDRILLNAAIELLQSVELLAQQKVEILEKPNTATWEELHADSVRLLEESREFLKGVDEREAAREAKLIKLRDEGIETERKLQEIRTGLAALPKPLSPEEQQKEAQEREKRRQELEKFLRVPSPELAAALKAESDSSKEYLVDSAAFALKIQKSFELRKQLNQNGLSDEQKKQIRAKIAIADEAKAQAKQKSKASFERLESLQEKINQLRQPAVTEKIGFVRLLKSSLSRSCRFRFVQNAPPTIDELSTAVEVARANWMKASADFSLAERSYDAAYYAQRSLPALAQDVIDADKAVEILQNQINNGPTIKDGYEKLIAIKQKALEDAKRVVAEKASSVARAKAAVVAAQAALNAYLAANPPKHNGLCQPTNEELARLKKHLRIRNWL